MAVPMMIAVAEGGGRSAIFGIVGWIAGSRRRAMRYFVDEEEVDEDGEAGLARFFEQGTLQG